MVIPKPTDAEKEQLVAVGVCFAGEQSNPKITVQRNAV